MQTIKKKIIVAIDVNPINSPDEEVIFIVNSSMWAGAVSSGYTRFRAEIEIDCPVADYTEVKPEQVIVKKETEDGK